MIGVSYGMIGRGEGEAIEGWKSANRPHGKAIEYLKDLLQVLIYKEAFILTNTLTSFVQYLFSKAILSHLHWIEIQSSVQTLAPMPS